ncbi:MAG: hypothetical protein A2521_16540 [Deltaproteobacteria bacterium RIFOXYD12_FULL_57_12]|nr:MAG: hypothetical protein A2521_16540 [Deltaproteobacteria bacterium RIFOXYD12_FULL_57_12]
MTRPGAASDVRLQTTDAGVQDIGKDEGQEQEQQEVVEHIHGSKEHPPDQDAGENREDHVPGDECIRLCWRVNGCPAAGGE